MMAFMPFSSVCVNAARVPVTLSIIDPTEDQGEHHRNPVAIPSVSLEDYTLTFSTPCYGWTLVLIDEDDEVVYTTIITSDTLVLPSALEGDYELRLIPGGSAYYFYGNITL